MEILIWGDNMKRQISVSIFCAILLIAMVWLYIKFYNERKPLVEEQTTEQSITKEEAVEISQQYTNYAYYAKDEDGRVVVYSAKKRNLYMETGIETFTLPSVIQEKLEEGIFFETEEKLYDFLESYSS